MRREGQANKEERGMQMRRKGQANEEEGGSK